MAFRAFEPGELVAGKYRIDAPLGEGGCALVYAATETVTARPVAIKLLKPDADGDYDLQTRARFRREVQALGALRDQHTVQMYSQGVTPEGILYAVFEQVPGQDLAEILASNGRLEPTVAEHILRQLLQSLREAHAAGILHRDIKPENVRVFERRGDPWTVKLLDFGIARPLDHGSPSLTATGELIGTPRYMSPEQLTERPLTPASDIYSLGMLTFEMLAGRDALPGGSWGSQLERLGTGYKFVVPRDAAETPLMDVVHQMTCKRASERLANADDVLRALDRGDAPLPQPISAPAVVASDQPAASPQISNTQLAAITGILMVAVLGVGAVLFMGQEPDPPAPTRATVARVPVAAPRAPEPPLEVRALEPDLPAGCKAKLEPGRRQVISWNVGLEREQVYGYVPTTYRTGKRHPVIVIFHSGGGRPESALDEVNLEEIADREGIVLLAPRGRIRELGKTIWRPWETNSLGQDRRPAVGRMLESLDRGICIDPERIFAIGDGWGGSATDHFECHAYLAASATTGYRLMEDRSVCADGKVGPHLVVSSTQDPGLPAVGGQGKEGGCAEPAAVSIDEHEARRRRGHGCVGEPREALGRPECQTWDCDTPFTACRVNGGQHWPGFVEQHRPQCSNEPADFQYGEAIWEFFKSVSSADNEAQDGAAGHD